MTVKPATEAQLLMPDAAPMKATPRRLWYEGAVRLSRPKVPWREADSVFAGLNAARTGGSQLRRVYAYRARRQTDAVLGMHRPLAAGFRVSEGVLCDWSAR